MKPNDIIDSATGLLCALITLAGMAFSMNAALSGGGESAVSEPPAASQTSVSDFRFDRESIRKMEMSQLYALIGNEDTQEEIRMRAQNELLLLISSMDAEAAIEEVLIARGHEDAVVTVHPASVNVVIKSGYDNKAESAFILDLVMRETGQSAGNVKIITAEEITTD